MALQAPTGWSTLFRTAFTQSRNAMVLVDDQRMLVDVNGAFMHLLGYRRNEVIGRPLWEFVDGGPRFTPREWAAVLAQGTFSGDGAVIHSDGHPIGIQWAATTETVTGRRLVLFVALSTSRWGPRFRRSDDPEPPAAVLTAREREIVHHVALGATAREIADELHIAHDTVRSHVRNAMKKLGARSRAHLVARAFAEGHTFHA